MMKRHLSAALLLFAVLNVGAEPVAWNTPHSEFARALALQGDARKGEDTFVICQGCHRVGALGRADGSYPRLAGQHISVLIKQMTDVRSGQRSNPKMLPFADHQAITVQEVADIAVFLQGLPVPPTQGQGPGNHLERGRQLYGKDCASCHGPQGQGDAAKFYPRISGQHYRYLQRETILIREGKRHNANPDMIKVIAPYTDEDIGVVTDFISRLPVERSKQK